MCQGQKKMTTKIVLTSSAKRKKAAMNENTIFRREMRPVNRRESQREAARTTLQKTNWPTDVRQ